MGESITAGGLEFFFENRTGREDGGPSLQVLGSIDGTRTQLLRFDMFREVPHYHYAPSGMNLRFNMDPLPLDDGIGWVINLLSGKLSPMLAKAGFEDLAADSRLAEATAALPEIESRWRAIC